MEAHSKKILGEGLTYDDVLLVPAYSEILPREVSIQSRFTRNISLNVPIISAAMDTFQNPEVARYMNENFYMVKLDGEGKEPIEFRGKTYKYVPSGRRGYHEFAAALLQGRLSYPTVVFLDEDLNMLSPVPGYQKPKPFLNIARYFGDNIYKDKDWQSYSAKGK